MMTDISELPSAAQQIAQYLIEAGYPQTVCLLPQSAHTAQQAADALGCQVAEIAKSIVFRRTQDDQAVLVITSGVNRVDVKKVAHITGEITRADPQFVKQKTGYVIGGVSPLKHATPIQLLIDQDLFKFEKIWAAAGHPQTVFSITPAQLLSLTAAQLADVAE